MKISLLPVLTDPEVVDALPILDESAETTKQITLATLLGMIYPIGSLYFNASDNTNPGTLLGFGTWVATAVGRVPVGRDASQVEFDTVGDTGGEKTHILTSGEMPSHAHGVNDPGHAHGFTGGGGFGAGPGNASRFRADANSPAQSWTFQINGAGTGISIQAAGGGAAHNNLQPYEVYYIWKRTA